MSPEQARGEVLDERTDIFSLGAVLYEMATGKVAFFGKTSAIIFKAILDETPIAISQRNPILPDRLNEIVNKALEKDRNLRYQSAADFRSDLQRLKRDSESGKVVASAPQQRSYKHWPGIAAFVVLLLAVGIGTYRHIAHRVHAVLGIDDVPALEHEIVGGLRVGPLHERHRRQENRDACHARHPTSSRGARSPTFAWAQGAC
jgi:hypothetical protein